jgi:hypothetical protein
VFLSLRRVLPNTYPLDRDVEYYLADEQRLGRLLDYAVIVPRLQRMYEWSALELCEPRLLELVRDGNPVYAWPFEERHVWRSAHPPWVARMLERATTPVNDERGRHGGRGLGLRDQSGVPAGDLDLRRDFRVIARARCQRRRRCGAALRQARRTSRELRPHLLRAARGPARPTAMSFLGTPRVAPRGALRTAPLPR